MEDSGIYRVPPQSSPYRPCSEESKGPTLVKYASNWSPIETVSQVLNSFYTWGN